MRAKQESHKVDRLTLHFRWPADQEIGPGVMLGIILEALANQGVVDEAKLLTIEGESPELPQGVVITYNHHEVTADFALLEGCPACLTCVICEVTDCCSNCRSSGLHEADHWLCECEGHECPFEQYRAPGDTGLSS